MTEASSSPDPSREFAAVTVLTWAAVVLPNLVQTLTAPKSRFFTSDTATLGRAASLVTLACTAGLAAVCVLAVARRLGALPGDRRVALLVLLLPWGYQVGRDLYLGVSPKQGGLAYPLIVVAVWVLRPRLHHLRTLGYLVGATAVGSLLLGALLPDKGVLVSTAGQIVTPDKQILPWGILVGPLTDGNPLGQFLCIGLPAVAFVPRRSLRLGLLGLTAFAVVWTSSRSSLFVIGVCAALVVLARVRPAGARDVVLGGVLAVLAVLVPLLPLTTSSNEAFTNRGYIWRASLQAWRTDPLFGLGSQWYAQAARYANNIGDTAYHGHNLFVQVLVLGGAVNLVLVAGLVLAVARAAVARTQECGPAAVAFVAAVLVSGTLEVSLSFVHLSFLLPVTLLPFAVTLLGARPDPQEHARGADDVTADDGLRPDAAAEPVTVPG